MLETVNPELRRTAAEQYLSERTGRLEYRFIRYGAVADELFAQGLNDQHLLVDVGAGMCDFDFYLRTVRGWKGRYLPVDASIDGWDLERGLPPHAPQADFYTALELIEHVEHPLMLLAEMFDKARTAVVITTPNTDVLGEQAVIEMDRTHVRPIYQRDLAFMGMDYFIHSFFGMHSDSLLGVRRVAESKV